MRQFYGNRVGGRAEAGWRGEPCQVKGQEGWRGGFGGQSAFFVRATPFEDLAGPDTVDLRHARDCDAGLNRFFLDPPLLFVRPLTHWGPPFGGQLAAFLSVPVLAPTVQT
jgi:hypothetical protein